MRGSHDNFGRKVEDVMTELAAEEGCEMALRAPRVWMQGDATMAMPGCIGEERRRSRRSRAAATACGGGLFAGDSVTIPTQLPEETITRRKMQKARHDTRIPFSAACRKVWPILGLAVLTACAE